MGALLNLIPVNMKLKTADSMSTIQSVCKRSGRHNSKVCYICHEISPAPYYAYLWGRELSSFFDLSACGYMLAANLHADTIDCARDQICNDNNISLKKFYAMNVIFFLEVHNTSRRIISIWESDGMSGHYAVAKPHRLLDINASKLVAKDEFIEKRRIIESLLATGYYSIQKVREYVLLQTSITE
jgi:hypothetical protein